jgi:nitroreductase
MVEIEHTVSTWPQRAGDVQLGAATVAAAIRRFGRGEPLPSGRLRIDLDTALQTLGDSTEPQPAEVPRPVAFDVTARMPPGPIGAVLQAMSAAPSGGNSQPWALSVVPGGVHIHLVAARTSAMDVAFRGSYVSIGAAAFNAQVAAARHGLQASITAFPTERDPDLAVSVALTPGSDSELAGLYPEMVQRITNRNPGRRRELAPEVAADLRRAAASAGAAVHLITDEVQIGDVADILAGSDRIRFLTPRLHQQMMAELTWFDHAALGIDVQSLGLDDADMAKLAVSSRPDVMAYLAAWNGGDALGDSTRDRVNSSSAVAVVTVPGDSPGDYVRGGSAVEQVWIRAGQHQLGVQPVSPVFLYARSDTDLKSLSEEFTTELSDLQRRFGATVGLQDSDAPVLVLRLSHDAPTPAVRSRRLERGAVMSTTDVSSKGWGQSW